MANRTDPLAEAVHGTDPQRLLPLILRDRIYSTTYWKEHCFGLSATDVIRRASPGGPDGARVRCAGGCYGGNGRPTRFLCLLCKMLQIQPGREVVDAMLSAPGRDATYVRLLAAAYLRMTGRPAEIHNALSGMLADRSPVDVRGPSVWERTHVDEVADKMLLGGAEVDLWGITLPRLVGRPALVEGGYLESVLAPSTLFPGDVADGKEDNEDVMKRRVKMAERLLEEMAAGGRGRSADLAREYMRERAEKRKEWDRLEPEKDPAVPSGAKEYEPADRKDPSAVAERVSRSRSRSRSWGRRARRRAGSGSDGSRDRYPHGDGYREDRVGSGGRRRHAPEGYRGYRGRDEEGDQDFGRGDRRYESDRDHDRDRDRDHDRDRERVHDRDRGRDHDRDRDRDRSYESKRRSEEPGEEKRQKKSLFKRHRDESPGGSGRRSRRDGRGRRDRDRDRNGKGSRGRGRDGDDDGSRRRRKEDDGNGGGVKTENVQEQPAKEGTVEYWNLERAKLGLKPLKK